MRCSSLPVSILIVGVGSADFGMMRKMDDDKGNLKDSKGVKPRRDCVQFVEFSKCDTNIAKLSQELLMEIPNQIEE